MTFQDAKKHKDFLELSVKNAELKIHLDENKHNKIVSDINNKGMALQDYMTIKALEILNTNIEVKPNAKKHPSLQFRLDATIYKLIEEKAKSLNKNITELFEDVLN